MHKPPRVLSCIQPTGTVHIGNYFGSIANWLKLQEQYQCAFGIANYHAMTMPFRSRELSRTTEELVISLVACGIRTEHIFIQSLVPERLELSWILSCLTPYDDLVDIFQAKSSQLGGADRASVGLLQFPLLQASDILVHHANLIPIGRDLIGYLSKVQHIAHGFNQRFEVDYFAEPEPLFTDAAEVRSVIDPSKKMSKSLGMAHCIGIFDREKEIRAKIGMGGNTSKAYLHQLLDMLPSADTQSSGADIGLAALQEETIARLSQWTAQLRERRSALMASRRALLEAVHEQSKILRLDAQATIKEVKEIVGLCTSFDAGLKPLL